MQVTSLQSVRNIADLRVLARRRVPRFSFDYVDGGAEDHITMARNRSAFDEFSIVPRQLAGLETVDLSTSVFGRSIAMPFAIAPTGYNGMLSRNGDLVLAEIAARSGIPFTQSTMSSSSIEDVGKVLKGGRHWFQLYMLQDMEITRRLVQRATAAGCEALVLTTDAIAAGNRESDRHNFSGLGQLSWSAKFNIATHPRWVMDVVLPSGPPGFGNLVEFLPKGQKSAIDGARFISQKMDRTISWKSVEWLRANWAGKLIVKGIMHPQDAVEAAKCGADAIVVSNHGGRQLDGAPSPLRLLPKVREALPETCEILVDSGFRRGSDIFKAVALGASAVLSGRATLYGLAAGGRPGVVKAVDILRSELERTMILSGYASIAAVRGAAMLET